MDFGLFLEFPRQEGMTESDAFTQCFALADEADKLGVDSVWLAEYHFNPGRVLSSPVTIASAIAARTERVRIGLGVYILPLGHPVRIAEEAATLDHISGGRLEFGIGRGTFPNVHEGYRVPFAESRSRFQEFLEIILKAWTTESFSYEGEYYSCQDLCVTPKPLQTPHPPIHVGITSAETFPIIGHMGHSIIINPSRVFTLPELAAYIQQYREAWHEVGHAGEPKVGLRIPVYLAETAEQAYSEPMESTMFAVHRLADRVAVSASTEGTIGDWRAQAERVMGMSYDDWVRDKVAYGTPEMVAEKLRQLQEDLGLSQIIFELNYGSQIPYERQFYNLQMMADQVIPQLK
jgi:alkanesulfonate monooxygenase SsuD/methylene tetrahydromethanopterin reductase-like flavin-dependent oxidoreductase (luciferase family)